MTWSNWSGSVRCEPGEVARPGSVEELAAVLGAATAAGRTVRPVGSGHSFTPLVAADDLLVDLRRLQGIEALDPGAGWARVLAGTRLRRLNADLRAAGLALENLGDVDAQTLAGALATGTHGTGARLGSLPAQVEALTLVTPAGDVLECSADRDPALFRAAQVSLGVLGIIARVTLRVVPAYQLAYRVDRGRLDEVSDRLPGLVADNRHFEFYWFPYSPWTMVKRQNVTTARPDRAHLRTRVVELVVDNGALWAISQTARAVPRLAPRAGRLAGAGFRPGAGVGASDEVFATYRKVRFQEMEYNLPAEHAAEAVASVRDCIEGHGFKVHLPVEVRFVAADDIWLSPAYERASVYIAVHAFRGMPYRECFRTVEQLFQPYAGRPHWGKMHTLQADTLRGRYPRFDDFLAVRERTDPAGTMLTPYLRALLGLPG